MSYIKRLKHMTENVFISILTFNCINIALLLLGFDKSTSVLGALRKCSKYELTAIIMLLIAWVLYDYIIYKIKQKK